MQDWQRRHQRQPRKWAPRIVTLAALVGAGSFGYGMLDTPSIGENTQVSIPVPSATPYIVEIDLPRSGTSPGVKTPRVASSQIAQVGTSGGETKPVGTKLEPVATAAIIRPELPALTTATTVEVMVPVAEQEPENRPPPAADSLAIAFGPGKQATQAIAPAATIAAPEIELRTVKVKIKKGDSLYSILKSRGIPGRVVPALLSGGKHGKRLTSLRPGQGLDLHLDSSGALAKLDYRIDRLTTVSYRRNTDGYASDLKELELERFKSHANGEIRSSLFLDGQRVGLSDRVIMQMAEIFGWDLDLAHDLRKGDRFTVVYEELMHEGRKVGDGNILAAQFTNRGKIYRAVRFVDPEGQALYFTPEGLSMRKAFLRSPVKFGRVSSGFNLKRRHPILHKIRAHRGVDYAAQRGTRIFATGDARVDFVGRKGGYGNTVVLRHGQTYSTLYAHLRGYARGLKRGKTVRQGQLIGYVGSSGLATGPHVHYEFRVRGQQKDPLRVKLPKSLPISPGLRRAFRDQTHKLIAMLDVYSTTTVAMR
jgi:murein DD-endopeptidase MepM/ murein hydrolase activator NlpD